MSKDKHNTHSVKHSFIYCISAAILANIVRKLTDRVVNFYKIVFCLYSKEYKTILVT